MIYFVPPTADLSAVAQQLQTAKISVVTAPSSIRELLQVIDANEEIIIPVTAKHLLLINQAVSEYFEDMPNVLTAIPGTIYDGAWMQQASTYPVVDWAAYSERIRKAGHTLFELEDAPKSFSSDPDEDNLV